MRKTCAVVAELSDALEAGGNAPHPIAKVIDDMINKFVLSSTLRKAGRQASEAREALGKPICYIVSSQSVLLYFAMDFADVAQ